MPRNKIVIKPNLNKPSFIEVTNGKISSSSKKKAEVRRRLEDLKIAKELKSTDSFY